LKYQSPATRPGFFAESDQSTNAVIPGRAAQRREPGIPIGYDPILVTTSGFRVRTQLRCARPGMTGS